VVPIIGIVDSALKKFIPVPRWNTTYLFYLESTIVIKIIDKTIKVLI